MTLTESQRKALEIVEKHGPIRPREFARLMWPDSDGWRRSSKCGPHGSSRGGGMNLAGGAYLGKLRQKGWVIRRWSRRYGLVIDKGYALTDAGKEELA